MMNTTRSNRLEMRWLPVVDGSGRTRIQATWIDVTAVADAGLGGDAAHAA